MIARRSRRAYTLFEVILVLAILVLAAALTYPSLKSMYGSYKLQGAVDSVRAAFAQARARAIEEGRPYCFAVEKGGAYFRVAPDHHEFWNGGGGEGGFVLQQALPAGVRFSVNAEPVPETGGDDETTPPAPSGNAWTPTAIFLPDGTAREDVTITFQVRGARPTQVHLRGLTGNVSVQTLSH